MFAGGGRLYEDSALGGGLGALPFFTFYKLFLEKKENNVYKFYKKDGTEIIGKEYLILREIDQGLSSIVYLVKSIVTGEIYAAKVYKTYSEYYLNEVSSLKILSSLNCPNIIHIISNLFYI